MIREWSALRNYTFTIKSQICSCSENTRFLRLRAILMSNFDKLFLFWRKKWVLQNKKNFVKIQSLDQKLWFWWNLYVKSIHVLKNWFFYDCEPSWAPISTIIFLFWRVHWELQNKKKFMEIRSLDQKLWFCWNFLYFTSNFNSNFMPISHGSRLKLI